MPLADSAAVARRRGLVCGYLACDAGLIKPVLAGLPRVVRVNLRNDPAGEWLEHIDRVTPSSGRRRPRPGSDVILARLAEVLFTEVLQRYVMQLPAGRTGWLAGAGDATVGRSLAALHHRPAHPWTLDELAEEAGVSRSALTERFARYLGESPMAYLTDWRLELGAEALRTSSRSVLHVASTSATSPKPRSTAPSNASSAARRRSTGALMREIAAPPRPPDPAQTSRDVIGSR